jgi:hypothetical protein
MACLFGRQARFHFTVRLQSTARPLSSEGYRGTIGNQILARREKTMQRRNYLLAGGLCLSAAAVLFIFRNSFGDQPKQTESPQTESPLKDLLARADDPKKAEPAKGDRGDQAAHAEPAQSVGTQQLPIGQVVLFSSGVGYFQREGTVDGTARVDLSFPVQDINDLLKSMVLRDLDGGHISTVSYDSNAPVERTLKSFAINLTGNPSFGAILNQARGEKVEVVLQQANATQPGTMSGTVVGMERQKVAVGKDTVETEMLNLWCADGMRSLKMTEVQRVRFLNPIMDSEFRKALETLSLSHDTQKKAVSINFVGDGKRNVRVGYVIENPIWKTSYRLVLDKKEKPYLQGWAVVENPTDEDWKDVRMALVSGRPISFQMDLYQPLYVPRPVVEPELFASLRPPTYSGGLEGFGLAREQQQLREETESLSLRRAADGKEKAANGAPAKPGQAGPGGRGGYYAYESRKKLEDRMDIGKSVGSAATASKLGDFFQYAIDRPVTLPRQKSAMLPIVAKDVEATRVSIYNEHTQAKFPLLGVKLKNTSGMHLNQGPITVFEGSNYAGDARILDLQPNEERLLSYAIDLGTEVNPVPSSDNGRLTVVKAVKGILYTTTKVKETKTYTIVNRNDGERLVLIEHPVRNDFKLVDTDKPSETASDFYRFQVKVSAGKSEKQVVSEERIINNSLQITNLDDNNIRIFINSPVTSQNVKDGLDSAMKLRWSMAKTQREIQELERQLKVITDDQARLRANLKEMPATAAAYKRYLQKFDEQETQIEKYQADIKKLQGVEHQQRKEFEDFLANFTAE